MLLHFAKQPTKGFQEQENEENDSFVQTRIVFFYFLCVNKLILYSLFPCFLFFVCLRL